MKKIFIIGIVAGGKTTLAKRMSETLNIPWYELDSIVHYKSTDGRNKRTAEEQVKVIVDIDKTGHWIFEGTDRASYRCLLDMADTIIFLDPPLWKRKVRIFTRFIKQKTGIEQCHYRADLHMLKKMYKWTSDFEDNRTSFEAELKKYEHKVLRLTSNQDINNLLQL